MVTQRHLRHVGKDCLVAFDVNLYSVPARRVRPRQLVEVRATKAQVTPHSTVPDASGQTLLTVHARAVGRGARIVDETQAAGTVSPLINLCGGRSDSLDRWCRAVPARLASPGQQSTGRAGGRASGQPGRRSGLATSRRCREVSPDDHRVTAVGSAICRSPGNAWRASPRAISRRHAARNTPTAPEGISRHDRDRAQGSDCTRGAVLVGNPVRHRRAIPPPRGRGLRSGPSL
ncbi:Mu transposase domain-containing protein [Streptomyces hawaiiensis]